MKNRVIAASTVACLFAFGAFSAHAADHYRLNLDLSVVDRKDGEQKSLMLGNREIFTDVTAGIYISEIALVKDNFVVLIGLYSGGTACPMQYRFITIPMDYDESGSGQSPAPATAGESWWSRGYHWVVSWFGLEIPSQSSRVSAAAPTTSGGILVSDEFGTCSEIYIMMLDSHSNRTRMSVFLDGFVGPFSDPNDPANRDQMLTRQFSYIPDSTKVSESIVR